MNAARSTPIVLLLATLSTLTACVGASARRESDADAALANLSLGAAYVRQGRADLAIEKLERAIDLDPRLANAHATIALAYDRLGDPEQAERHYRRATELEPQNSAAANSYAVFLCRQERWSDAEPYFKRVTRDPGYATPAAALTNAGLCAWDAGELERADEYLRAALEHDAAFPDALASLMELSYQRQNFLQARAFMQRYNEVSAQSAASLWLCYNIEQELGDRDAAARCANRLRDEFPESAELAQLRQSERDAQR